METIFSITEAKSRFSDIINRIIYKKEKITITKNGKRVAVIFPIEAVKSFEEKGLIQAKGALEDLDDVMDEMVGMIYESRGAEKGREVDL
jgi:prevent-host-death family protein